MAGDADRQSRAAIIDSWWVMLLVGDADRQSRAAIIDSWRVMPIDSHALLLLTAGG